MNCSSSDLGYSRPKFTWTNCRGDGVFIKERLNRAVANKEWCEKFQAATVQVLAVCSSDHKPLVVDYKEITEERRIGKKGFKFEAKCMVDEECKTIINWVWHKEVMAENPLLTVCLKLQRCQSKLTGWSQRKFRDTDERLKKKVNQLERLQRNENLQNWEEIKQLQGEIDFILEQENIKWK